MLTFWGYTLWSDGLLFLCFWLEESSMPFSRWLCVQSVWARIEFVAASKRFNSATIWHTCPCIYFPHKSPPPSTMRLFFFTLYQLELRAPILDTLFSCFQEIVGPQPQPQPEADSTTKCIWEMCNFDKQPWEIIPPLVYPVSIRKKKLTVTKIAACERLGYSFPNFLYDYSTYHFSFHIMRAQ